MNPHSHECFTDFALQEYALGRLDPAVRGDVAEHTAGCPECGAALHAFEAETVLLREALKSAIADAPDLTDEILALYSGGALPPEEAARAESILSRHPAALQRLIALTTETGAVRTGEVGEVVSNPQPAGEILRMPKRIARPVTVTITRRARGG